MHQIYTRITLETVLKRLKLKIPRLSVEYQTRTEDILYFNF